MSVRVKKCCVKEIDGSLIVCDCGWHYREHRAGEYGASALKDALLDRYNDHRASRARAGAEGPAA